MAWVLVLLGQTVLPFFISLLSLGFLALGRSIWSVLPGKSSPIGCVSGLLLNWVPLEAPFAIRCIRWWLLVTSVFGLDASAF